MNTVTLIGTVKDIPEMKKTNNGLHYANLVIECMKNNENDKQDFSITFWNGQVNYIKESISNGDKVCIKAHLRSNNFQKENGELVYKCEIVGEKILIV